MSKKWYVGVNNVAREVKHPYIGVNNVARKVKNGYVGVGGVARQFFIREYTWEKYNVDVVNNYGYRRLTSYLENVTAPPNYQGSHTWNTTTLSSASSSGFKKTGTITLPGNWANNDKSLVNGTYLMADSYSIKTDSDDDDYYYFTYIQPGEASYSKYAVYITDFSSGHYKAYIYEVYVEGTTSSVKGSYVSEVKSTDENAYPVNGIHTDGYWYVKQ